MNKNPMSNQKGYVKHLCNSHAFERYFLILGQTHQCARKTFSDLIREVLLSVRLIYVAGLSSCVFA